MDALEFINIIYPEHGRTSCSDDNISNGFYLKDDEDGEEVISKEYYPRCMRCALLEIENGTIKLTDKNKQLIPERLS